MVRVDMYVKHRCIFWIVKFSMTFNNGPHNVQSFSHIIKNNKEDALETTKVESKKIIDFFPSNNFVNIANKAAIIYNSKGKGSEISVDIGGKMLTSTYTEKLLGLHTNADLK